METRNFEFDLLRQMCDLHLEYDSNAGVLVRQVYVIDLHAQVGDVTQERHVVDAQRRRMRYADLLLEDRVAAHADAQLEADHVRHELNLDADVDELVL